MLDIVKQHLADLSAGKWNEFKARLGSDIVYEEYPTRLRVKGADEYVKAIQRWRTAFPDMRANVLQGYASGDNVFLEVEWTGTHDGPFDGPFGSIAATHKKGSVKAALVYKLKNEKIVETRHYFDLMTVLSQLGIMPAVGAGAPAPRAGATPPVRH